MRYRHETIEGIESYLSAEGLRIHFCDLWGTAVKDHGVPALRAYLAMSFDPVADDATIFAVATQREQVEPISLKQAIRSVEDGTSDFCFVLQAYADGGLISFSHDLLPFQHDAQPADWWTIEKVELRNRERNPWNWFRTEK